MKHIWAVKTTSLKPGKGIDFYLNFFKTREEARMFKKFMSVGVKLGYVRVTLHKAFETKLGGVLCSPKVEY